MDRQAQAAVEVAEQSYVAAQERANDKVEEIFALASAAFAKLDLEKDRQANVAAPNAVTDIQLRQKELAYKRAQLQTEKARKDRLIASKEAAVKKAELEASKIMLEHRVIRAPFDGEVQQLFHRQAEWVKPGEPIQALEIPEAWSQMIENARADSTVVER